LLVFGSPNTSMSSGMGGGGGCDNMGMGGGGCGGGGMMGGGGGCGSMGGGGGCGGSMGGGMGGMGGGGMCGGGMGGGCMGGMGGGMGGGMSCGMGGGMGCGMGGGMGGMGGEGGMMGGSCGGGGGDRNPLTTADGRVRTDRRGLPLEGIDGNWRCQNCGNVNFGSRDQCNRCKVPKPEGLGMSEERIKKQALEYVARFMGEPDPWSAAVGFLQQMRMMTMMQAQMGMQGGCMGGGGMGMGGGCGGGGMMGGMGGMGGCGNMGGGMGGGCGNMGGMGSGGSCGGDGSGCGGGGGGGGCSGGGGGGGDTPHVVGERSWQDRDAALRASAIDLDGGGQCGGGGGDAVGTKRPRDDDGDGGAYVARCNTGPLEGQQGGGSGGP